MARNSGKEGASDDPENPGFVDLTKLAQAVKNRQDTIEGLGEDVLTLAEATAGLTAEVRLVDYQRKVDKRRNIALFGMLGVIMVCIGVGLAVLLHFASSNKQLLTKVQDSQTTSQQVLDEVRSCTSPDGECAKRGQKATGQAVFQLKQITVFAAACAVQHVNNPQTEVIQRCVEDLLARTQE